jgi:hypothetical protein
MASTAISQPELPGADDQHPLALEDLGVTVGARMHQLTRKTALEFGHVGLRQGAVGDQHSGKLRLVLRAVRFPPGHPPAITGLAERLGRQHFRTEAVVIIDPEMIREIAEVALEFPMRRILGHLAVHREIREFGHLLRRDQVRGLVHGRLRTVDVPKATDIGMQFESGKGNALLDQRLGHGQPHRARADQRVMIAQILGPGRILLGRLNFHVQLSPSLASVEILFQPNIERSFKLRQDET